MYALKLIINLLITSKKLFQPT